MNAKASAEEAGARYEAAEGAFLAGIREERERATLSELADDVAVQATAWSSAEYEALHAATTVDERTEHDHTTERTEVLAALWADVARAFHGDPAHRDG